MKLLIPPLLLLLALTGFPCTSETETGEFSAAVRPQHRMTDSLEISLDFDRHGLSTPFDIAMLPG